MARPKRNKVTYSSRSSVRRALREAERKRNRTKPSTIKTPFTQPGKAKTVSGVKRLGRRGQALRKAIKGQQMDWTTSVTQVTSMRGRIHPSAQQPMDQPQTAQNVWVDSTAISSYKYDEKRKVLAITFLTSGATYWYFNVPKDVVKGFNVAGSKGRYFNRMIKNRYSFSKK